MQLSEHVHQMAQYNQWMNQKLYEACEKISPEQLSENRGAFFGSILGTLNHLVVADTICLKLLVSARISRNTLSAMKQIPYPKALNDILFNNLKELKNRREQLDQLLLAFSEELQKAPETTLQKAITYKNTKGVSSNKCLFSLLMHLFNHQTHHRGQITTLLSQLGIDIGITDLVTILPNIEE
jgi:uncharacterized damage-inducible protein DinB